MFDVKREFEKLYGAICQLFARKEDIVENDLTDYVKKDQLAGYATKDQLDNYAQKSVLSNYATKDDLEEYVLFDYFEDNAVTDLQLRNYVKNDIYTSDKSSMLSMLEDLQYQLDQLTYDIVLDKEINSSNMSSTFHIINNKTHIQYTYRLITALGFEMGVSDNVELNVLNSSIKVNNSSKDYTITLYKDLKILDQIQILPVKDVGGLDKPIIGDTELNS